MGTTFWFVAARYRTGAGRGSGLRQPKRGNRYGGDSPDKHRRATFAKFIFIRVASSQQLAQLDRLERQVGALITAYQRLREELADANTLNQQLQAEVREQDKQRRTQQNQENIVKLVQTIAGEPTHANELKHRLTEYIRELDKCLAYLKE